MLQFSSGFRNLLLSPWIPHLPPILAERTKTHGSVECLKEQLLKGSLKCLGTSTQIEHLNKKSCSRAHPHSAATEHNLSFREYIK